MSDDWLWDKSSPADPEDVRLSEGLSAFKYRGAPPKLQPRHSRPAPWLLGGAALLAASLLLALWPESASVASFSCGEGCELAVGEWLSVEDGPVDIEVADIGTLRASVGAKIKLSETSASRHRLTLDRGHVHARVNAPPRLLVVDTPSAQAVDLGCEYDLTVLEDGSSLLIVTTGEVSLEGERTAYVPAGAAAMTWPGHGPGVPWFADSPVSYAEALVAFDGQRDRSKLTEILDASTPRDTLSLWHLLQRTSGSDRARVLSRLYELAPKAKALPAQPLLSLEEDALLSLREELSDLW